MHAHASARTRECTHTHIHNYVKTNEEGNHFFIVLCEKKVVFNKVNLFILFLCDFVMFCVCVCDFVMFCVYVCDFVCYL
jgi:hypothetical protein